MTKTTERALRSFLQGLVADGKQAEDVERSALVDWTQANARAAESLLRDLRQGR